MLDQIVKQYNNKLNRLISFYRNNFYRIIRSRLSSRSKNIYVYRLRQYYFNEKNKLDREKSRLISEYRKQLTIDNNSNKSIKALMVGINYNNTNYQLKGCINDVNNLKKFFSIKRGLQDKNVCLLTDNTELKPTRKIILEKYKELLLNAKKGDLLLFTYAGHGYYTRDYSGDEKDNRDEVLVSVDFKGIKDDELKSMLDQYLPEGVKVFILFDCCNSGTLMDLKYNYLSTNNYNNIVVNNKCSETKGDVYFISGCKDDQQSADAYINNQYQGAMSWAFVKTISENRNLTWKNLLLGMRKLLVNRYIQIPQLSSGKNMDINSKIFI